MNQAEQAVRNSEESVKELDKQLSATKYQSLASLP
jgi:hypothetical protein